MDLGSTDNIFGTIGPLTISQSIATRNQLMAILVTVTKAAFLWGDLDQDH